MSRILLHLGYCRILRNSVLCMGWVMDSPNCCQWDIYTYIYRAGSWCHRPMAQQLSIAYLFIPFILSPTRGKRGIVLAKLLYKDNYVRTLYILLCA